MNYIARGSGSTRFRGAGGRQTARTDGVQCFVFFFFLFFFFFFFRDKDECAEPGMSSKKFDLARVGWMAVLEQAISPRSAPQRNASSWIWRQLAGPDGHRRLPAVQRRTNRGCSRWRFAGGADGDLGRGHAPRHFYDIVVEVAIHPPRPIVGQMVNPYLEAARLTAEPTGAPHPSLWPVAARADPGRAAVPGADDAHRHDRRRASPAARRTELRRAMGSKAQSLEGLKRSRRRLGAGGG